MTATQCDVAIIGAGPAGIAAAIWLQKYPLTYLLIDREAQIGGELMRINLPIRDYPGLELANGRAFRNRLELTLHERPLSTRLSCEVRAVDPVNKTLVLRDGSRIQARALILAMGLRRRRLGLEGEDELAGESLSYSATSDRDRLAGHAVVVIGGGDGACENALFLAEYCPQVSLIHRGAQLRAREEFRQALAGQPRVRLFTGHHARAFVREGTALSGLVLDGPQGEQRIFCTRVVVKIGFEPNVSILPHEIPGRDAAGYLRVDRYLHTDVPGVFAAGDISNPRCPCISAAMGDGAVVAQEVAAYLNARNV